jgi:type I site-specific restriction endonuclease
MNEADTCRKFVVPKLQAAGWENDPYSIAEQRYFTDGRIIVRGNATSRKRGKKADYLLRYRRDFPIAVVEAKSSYKKPSDATGTGKTVVAFQICWKLWASKWNAKGDPNRKPRILYLADRNFLVDDPKDKTFSAFGDARQKIEGGEVVFSRQLYFATYQSIPTGAKSSNISSPRINSA